MAPIKELESFLALVLAQAESWVFAYGSLMWKRGFDCEAVAATLSGWQRKFCIASTVYRGSPEDPGLVLGLDHGDECVGQALRLPERGREAIVRALWQREMVNGVYQVELLPVQLHSEARTQACWCFVRDPLHPSYRPALTPEQSVEIIRRARGIGGANTDYLFNTYQHLRALGVEDEQLAQFCKLCRQS